MKRRISKSGFTLIEILVVVAIIALLISILLPSLSRARGQARLVACESNIRQLGLAAAMYASQSKGRFPADSKATDLGMDWIGRNSDRGIPEGGSLWRYMNKAKAAYTCPDDRRNTTDWYWSYAFNIMMSGSPAEAAQGAHYPAYPTALDMARVDHTTQMRSFGGVPLFAEESIYTQSGVTDGAWTNEDGFETRHLRSGSKNDSCATLAFTDGHAGTIKLYYPENRDAEPSWRKLYFSAADMCIRSGRLWHSGADANGNWSKTKNKGLFGWISGDAGSDAAGSKKHF